MLGWFHEDVSKQNFKNMQSCLSVERFSKWHHCSQPLLWWYKILSLQYHTLQVSLEHGQTDLKICLKYLLQYVIIGMSPGCFQSVNCKLSIKTTFILEKTTRARTHIVSTGGVAMIWVPGDQNIPPTKVKVLYTAWKGKAATQVTDTF